MHVRGTLRDIQEWTIQKSWQHWIHNPQDEDKENKKKHNLICAGTTVCKQTRLM